MKDGRNEEAGERMRGMRRKDRRNVKEVVGKRRERIGGRGKEQQEESEGNGGG